MSPAFWQLLILLSILPPLLRALPPINPFDTATSLLKFSSTSPNSSIPSFNISDRSAQPICDSTRAGRGLRRASCEGAYGLIPSSSRLIRLSRRDSPSALPDVQVPRRYSSSDGTCVIDIFIPVDSPGGADTVRWDQIRRAARRVLMTCVVDPWNDGGYISQIGTNGHIIVLVSRYNPNVLCYGGIAPQPSFAVEQSLLDQIPTTSVALLFGSSLLSDVEVIVPRYFTSRQEMGNFEAIVDTIHLRARGRWVDLWAGAVAINAMCVGVLGHSGVAVLPEGLKITLSPRQMFNRTAIA